MQDLLALVGVPVLVGVALFFIAKYTDPLWFLDDGFFKQLWALFVAIGLMLLSAHIVYHMAVKSSENGSEQNRPDGEVADEEIALKPEQEKDICGEQFTSQIDGDWNEALEHDEYKVRYSQVQSSSGRLARKKAVVTRKSDDVIVGLAEVMNLDLGCYWEWASSTKMLSRDSESECALEYIFENPEVRAIFGAYRHYTFLGLASQPGTQDIDYLKLTTYRANNLCKAAARVMPEELWAQSTPLALGLGRSQHRRKRGSSAEKLERSGYMVGVRECLTEVGDELIASVVLNTAEVSGVRFSEYSDTPASLIRITRRDFRVQDPFEDWGDDSNSNNKTD